MPTVVSVFGVEPIRIGGTETFARELSSQLSDHGWQSVLCFLGEPPEDVGQFLKLRNVSLEVLQDSIDLSWKSTRRLAGILRRYKPEILHLHFTGFLGIYPWLGRAFSAQKVFHNQPRPPICSASGSFLEASSCARDQSAADKGYLRQ